MPEVYDLDIPVRYRRWGIASFSLIAQAKVADFLADRQSLYLYGKVGTKKSSLAAAVLGLWRTTGLPSSRGGWGEFVPSYLLADAMRNFGSGPAMLRHWKEAPILVLDDLGSARDTAHVTEQTVFLVQWRYDHDLPTIATSNLSLEELARQTDARLASRLQEGIVLDLGDTDYRAKEK